MGHDYAYRSNEYSGKDVTDDLRGDRGVLPELTDEVRVCAIRTKRFLLGCMDPERLAAAIGKQ